MADTILKRKRPTNEEILYKLEELSNFKGQFRSGNLANWATVIALLGTIIYGYSALNAQVEVVTSEFNDLKKNQAEMAQEAKAERKELVSELRESIDNQNHVNLEFTRQLTEVVTLLKERDRNDKR